jgi:16S rRNA (guanine527-N7)-methyltransferase
LNSSNERLERLAELVAGWPGLVARPDPRLVADALVLLPYLEDAGSVVDVGSGGGLPGLALKAVRPGLDLTLIESNRRKAAFLEHAAASLGLHGVRVVARRAEEAGHDPGLRESFDAAVVRALAAMPVLVELCLPLLRVGGVLLAMKVDAGAEVRASEAALDALGGALVGIEPAPSALRDRGQVVVVRKVTPTPAGFPRRSGVPQRRPLGK